MALAAKQHIPVVNAVTAQSLVHWPIGQRVDRRAIQTHQLLLIAPAIRHSTELRNGK